MSTSLGPWVSRRSVFNRADHADVFKEERLASSQLWAESRRGQHVELGIAENNLFLLLAALGLSGPLFGQRLIPVGTLYDPFIARGLDALTYASYQNARFLLVATPSGISLAPEGGAHQSVATPLIGIGQPELLSFEPAYADELAEMLRFALRPPAKRRRQLGLSAALDADRRPARARDDRGAREARARRRRTGCASRLAARSSRWSVPARSCPRCSRPPMRWPTICRGLGCS